MSFRFPSFLPSRNAILLGGIVLAGLHVVPAVARPLSDAEVSQLSLEELLVVEVYSAEHYARQLSGAASSISTVTAEDIRRFGYRTLADILKSLPGLHVAYDRNYSYLGARGFGIVGDWNSRILFMVDGHRVNDNVYDSAYIGHDFIVDIGLVERVEYVAGPAAAMLYGNHAFFGAVNVITKTGQQLNGGEISGGAGSADSRHERMSYGKRLDNGLDLLLSASRYQSGGRDFYIPEFGGTARGRDDERADRFFAKLTRGDFTLELANAERAKGIPNASYGQVFNDPRSRTVDANSLVSLKYNRIIDDARALSARLYQGSYDYRGDYVYDLAAAPPPQLAVNRDTARGRWWGGELKYVDGTLFDGHKLLFGADFQRNLARDQKNRYLGQAPIIDDRRDDQAWGVYAHDEIALGDAVTLDIGGRYDKPPTGAGMFHPRLGLIHRWRPETTLKALYGEAFRPPNVYELYYDLGDNYRPNPELRPEHIKTLELVAEHQTSPAGRLVTSLFRNEISDLIDYVLFGDPDGAADSGDEIFRFANARRLRTTGIELRYEHALPDGGQLRVAYTGQRTRDPAGGTVQNSPHHLAKLNWRQPVFNSGLHAGLEMQYVGPRLNYAGTRVAGNLLTNLTLSGSPADGLVVSLTATNLFNRRIADPAAFYHDPLRTIPLDGRAWYLQANFRF